DPRCEVLSGLYKRPAGATPFLPLHRCQLSASRGRPDPTEILQRRTDLVAIVLRTICRKPLQSLLLRLRRECREGDRARHSPPARWLARLYRNRSQVKRTEEQSQTTTEGDRRQNYSRHVDLCISRSSHSYDATRR